MPRQAHERARVQRVYKIVRVIRAVFVQLMSILLYIYQYVYRYIRNVHNHMSVEEFTKAMGSVFARGDCNNS